MQIQLPSEVQFILEQLKKNGYEAYVVGGAVRDLIRQTSTPPDFDFTTNATPEQIQAIFPESFYENEFGTVGIAPEHIREMMGVNPTESEQSVAQEDSETTKVIDVNKASKIHASLQLKNQETEEEQLAKTKAKPYEITTFRSDGVYSDHRRPESVTWGKSIDEDLARRDFTINAMALKKDGTLIDPYDGEKDLRDHLIRTVGQPHERFKEDALRMLRAIRFSVQLNMKMTDEVFTAIAALAADIQHVSWERVSDEFMKMLRSEYPAEAIELLEETGLLHYILPELREGKNVEQGGHHTTDVWTHSIDALRECPSQDPVVRLATLLHDVAKPRTYKMEGNNKPTFYNHEIVGARMAKAIAQRFRFSKKDTDRVFTLVRHHMFHYQPKNTDAAIRRFMRKVGLENINDILDLREGDRLGSGARKTSWRLEEMKERMIEQLHQPFDITDLEIDGNDLMTEFDLKPGRIIGETLKYLFEKVLDEPELNTKEKLRELAKEFLTTNQKSERKE